jgi:hypothetical protein
VQSSRVRMSIPSSMTQWELEKCGVHDNVNALNEKKMKREMSG